MLSGRFQRAPNLKAVLSNSVQDGWDLVREDKTGVITETTKYLVPEGEVLAFERDGEMFYLHGDALSSTQLITDENGDQVARFVYGAWGEELHANDNVPGGTECRFVGGLGVRTDPVTGLIYMRARWYSPDEMRFISRDPIGLKGGSNPYSYALNPATNADPTGLDDVYIGHSNEKLTAIPEMVYQNLIAPFGRNGHKTHYPYTAMSKIDLFYALRTNDLVYTLSHGSSQGLDLGPNGQNKDLFFTELEEWVNQNTNGPEDLAKIVIFSGCQTAQTSDAAKALGALDPQGGRAFAGWDVSVPNFFEGPFAKELLNNLAEGYSIGQSKERAVRILESQGKQRNASFAQKHFRIYGDPSTGLSY